MDHRISLLTHYSPTGTNQTLLRVPLKLMLTNRTKIPQIFLVHAELSSYNQSLYSSIPPDKTGTHSNGENSSSHHLGLDLPRPLFRPGQSRLIRHQELTATYHMTVNNLKYHVTSANKENWSPGPKKPFSRSLFLPTYPRLGLTNFRRPESGNEALQSQANVLNKQISDMQQITRTPGTYRISSTLTTSHKPLPGQNKSTQMGGNRKHSVYNKLDQSTTPCNNRARHSCADDTIPGAYDASTAQNPTKECNSGNHLQDPRRANIQAINCTHTQGQQVRLSEMYTKYIQPLGWTTPYFFKEDSLFRAKQLWP